MYLEHTVISPCVSSGHHRVLTIRHLYGPEHLDAEQSNRQRRKLQPSWSQDSRDSCHFHIAMFTASLLGERYGHEARHGPDCSSRRSS